MCLGSSCGLMNGDLVRYVCGIVVGYAMNTLYTPFQLSYLPYQYGVLTKNWAYLPQTWVWHELELPTIAMTILTTNIGSGY